jgi:CheY-like chemotaxis protein
MTLNVLLVDDDRESLELLASTLPETIADETLRWEPCSTFDEAFRLIEERRFDIVVTDIYRDQEGVEKLPTTGDPRGTGLLDEIRRRRFSPVLFITDGTFPPDYHDGPFLKLADKSDDTAIRSKMTELIETGVPSLAHALHDELDSASGSYLWNFLDTKWEEMVAAGLTERAVLDRLLHRRASVQLSRLDGSEGTPIERSTVEGAEFYLTPRIASGFRLGEIVYKGDEYRVVLTPHCHLVVQPGQAVPRANFVLTVRTVSWEEAFQSDPLRGSDAESRLRNLRPRLQSPAQLGRPMGRYWFLPGFLSMSHRFVDFMQLQSLSYAELSDEWKQFAVLDVPFAEALQSCFVHFYSAVGLPVLNPERFADLIAAPPADG